MDEKNSNLVKRLHAGDKTAFEYLYKQYSHRIYLNALKLIKDANVAEDIVQDVFIILWEKRLTIDPSRPILNWIFVVSYNKSVDYLKQTLKTACYSSEERLSDISADDQSKDDVFIREQRLNLIESAARKLSPQKRRVFELCKLRGQTYEYAAREMQISKHTVKEYLSAAMKNIRSYVGAAQKSR